VHASIVAGICHLGLIAVGELIQQRVKLRLHFAAGPAGAAGHLHWDVAFFAARHWGVCFGTHWAGPACIIFGEVQPPERFFVGVDGEFGLATTALLWIYDRVVKPGEKKKEQRVGTLRGPLHEQMKNQEEREEIRRCSMVRAHPSQNTRRMGAP